MYKGKRHERSKNDQTTKFKLLAKAKILIELSTTYQEYDESLIGINRKRRKRLVHETAVVRYWGLVAIIQNFRVKVIVRQVGNGQKHFWSVMPAWRTNHYRNIEVVSMSKGNLAED